MIPDPNCHCDQCEYYREQEALRQSPTMDVKYASSLSAVYERIHKRMLEHEAEAKDWPVCIDPRKRYIDYQRFMTQRADSDAWANYYKAVSYHIEALLEIQPPEDKTKLK